MPVPHPARLVDLLQSLQDSSVSILLESQFPYGGLGYLASQPKMLLTARGTQLKLEQANGETEQWVSNAWDALDSIISTHPGWWFCALSYDLKNQDESLSSSNPDEIALPDLIAFQPSLLVEIDRNGSMKPLLGSVNINTEYRARAAHVTIEGSSSTESQYHESIHGVLNDIREGEYYELNLSHQLKGTLVGDPVDLYCAMAAKGPVPMAAYLHCGDTHVICASPERYLKREGSLVTSEPIKGTRPRSSDAKIDQNLRDELANSEKDRAENLMIVDLVRNDLARIAAKGSVQVRNLFEVRSYATVHQMVSTVVASVDEKRSSVDIIRNTFPMGSMTGAPKIRVMDAIERYETYRRGLYSGAIGYIAPNGDFDFNVVIRSAFVKGAQVWYPVGGAITADSHPETEWEETLVKSRALP